MFYIRGLRTELLVRETNMYLVVKYDLYLETFNNENRARDKTKGFYRFYVDSVCFY